MVIDASVIVSLALNEPDAPTFERRIAAMGGARISAATLVEATIVLEGRMGEDGGVFLDLWLLRAKIDIVPLDAAQAQAARRAWRRYGKGRHPAGLNFGDCFSYALAKTSGEPLLFKGDDFALTDVAPA